MPRPQNPSSASHPMASTMLVLSLLLALVSIPSRAVSFSVITNFLPNTGQFPYAGLTADAAGNFYGTTAAGGNPACPQFGCGTVFRLSPSGSGWALTTLYHFQGGADGWQPFAPVVFGPDGSLYGTTENGGSLATSNGFGTVFKLAPSSCTTCPWRHSVLYRFTGGADGGVPSYGNLTFDSAGVLYGTTIGGGHYEAVCLFGGQGCGVVFQLTPSSGGWSESVLHSFTGGLDGDAPLSGVTFDQKGNLYGTASEGGAIGYGTVYQLTPSAGRWTETTLHSFSGGYDGAYSAGGLVPDSSGNLYGTTSASIHAGGTVFELVTSASGWTFLELYLFAFPNDPTGNLTLANGNLYGETFSGGIGNWGSVFELTPGPTGWTATTVYSFKGQDKNGGLSPRGGLVVDASGNIYGTTSGGGIYYDGVVFKITP